jgi:predicted glycoside hydrolase/deacetylase ChbG (UPF0249 family)
MPVQLHADDLGLHPAVDRAILRAHQAGALGGASILASGPTFPHAAAQARASGLPLGLHLAIVDTAPLSPPAEVPSLVGADGRFPSFWGRVAPRAALGRLRRDELRLELGRQLRRFAEAGLIGPAGLQVDGHQHLHLLPSVFDRLLELGPEFGLTAFRLPRLSPVERRQWSPRAGAFRLVERLGARAARISGARGPRPVPCWGVLFAGHLTLARARSVLASLPADANGQLLCHPGDDDRALQAEKGWGFAWETELATALALGRRGGR